MAAIDDSQSLESPAAWKERSFRRMVFGVSSSVGASWSKLRYVDAGVSSRDRVVDAGEPASAIF
jgi:hypothetical protein